MLASAETISHTYMLSYFIHNKLCLPQDLPKWFSSSENYQLDLSPYLKLQFTDEYQSMCIRVIG